MLRGVIFSKVTFLHVVQLGVFISPPPLHFSSPDSIAKPAGWLSPALDLLPSLPEKFDSGHLFSAYGPTL